MGSELQKLILWQRAKKFRHLIWCISGELPDEEKFRLKDQLIRSSRSVTANIAEGNGRFYFKENIQFCRRARGSLLETFDHLTCAFECQYLDQEEFDSTIVEYENLLRLLNGYIRYLKSNT